MVDLLDVYDVDIIHDIRRSLSSHKFHFGFAYYRTTAEREGLMNFLSKFTTNVEYLGVDFYGWTENETNNLFTTIGMSNIKVCRVFISRYQINRFICELKQILNIS